MSTTATHPDPPSRLHRLLATDSSFRALACDTTELVSEAARRHGVSGLAAVALGRTLTAAQLLATLTKGTERITLQLVGDGPLRGVVADAWSDGRTRGYLHEKLLLPHTGPRRPSLRRALGAVGTVTVFRDLGLKEIYQGHGAFNMGEVDEDVEAYLRVSEQVPTALGCEVLLDDAGQAVRVAAGVMIQAMPGTQEQEGDPVREAQHALRTGVLRHALEGGERDPDLLAATVVPGYALRRLSVTPLSFHCPCDRSRVEGALLTLGVDELRKILQEDGGTTLGCHFCGEQYALDAEDLQALISGLLESRGQ